jgi:hypothetical protein
MKKTVVAGAATILTGLSAALVALPGPAVAAATATCSTHWGTGTRDKAQLVQNRVRDLRVGRHACFDRLVVDLGVGRLPGYHVGYVRAFHAEGSGKLVPASGHAKLLVNVHAPAAASFAAGNRHLVGVVGFTQFRQVAGLGSFEGVTSIGVGLQATAPFRVLEFRTASHQVELVIDVAHH